MPKFRNLILGLAASTALAGGAVTLSTTAATATTSSGTTTISSGSHDHWGWGRGRRCANRNRLDNRNIFHKRYKIHKHESERSNAIFATGDAVVDIDGDDD